jgi:hypothetical protein
MSSNLASARRRLHAGRLKRVALTAVAVTVGAIILSGCVVIQSESALQGNVIGNTVTVTTVICASSKTAAPPCNSVGNFQVPGNANAGYAVGSSGTLLVGYRIPIGVAAPASFTTTTPTNDKDGNVVTATVTFTQSPSYSAGLTALVPPPAGTAWVGYESTPGGYSTTPGLAQAISLSPTFTLPPGFTGNFTWRTVVGFRDNHFAGQPVTCPAPFPGVTPPNALPTVCVDFPDPGTIVNAAPNALQVADLSIGAPATPTVSAGSTAVLMFTGLFIGGNPTGAVFAVGASTTLPGVTPTVTPTLAPTANSSNPLTVNLTIPAKTPPGTYDITVGATVAGLSRSGTGHITVKAPSATASGAGSSAKLAASVKKTTLKVARKTGIPLTFTLSKTSSISVVALQTKPKVSVTVRKSLKAGKKTVVLLKSKKLHRGKITITFKGGGVTRVITTTIT